MSRSSLTPLLRYRTEARPDAVANTALEHCLFTLPQSHVLRIHGRAQFLLIIMAIGGIRTIAGNAIFVLTSDVANKATAFVLYLLVARHLSTFAFGQMSLALHLFYLFQVLAVAGLKTFVTREIAKHKSSTDKYLVNGGIVATAFSLVSITILLVFVRLMRYAPETADLIIILSLGLLPYALSAISEAVFQAWEQMHYIAYANVSVNIAKVSLAFLLLSQGYGLYHLVVLMFASYIAIMAIEWGFMLRYITMPSVSIDARLCLAITRITSTFLGIDFFISIVTTIDIILLSKLTNETEVGLYNAARQLIVPMTLVYHCIVLSVFPMMCKKYELNFQSLKPICENVLGLLLVVAVPAVVGLFFLGDSLLLLLYKDENFLRASGVLEIITWTLIPIALTSLFSQVLVASQREKVTLRIAAINALVSLVFGLIFIGQFGMIGAAITALLRCIVDFCQHYVPVARLLPRFSFSKQLWKPALASMGMAVYLAVIEKQGIILPVISAGILYIAVLLALVRLAGGSLWQFRGALKAFAGQHDIDTRGSSSITR